MCSTISNALQQKSVQTQFPTNFHQSVPVTAYHSDQTVTNFPYFTLHLLQSNNNGHRTPGALNRKIITDSNFQLWAVCFSDVCVINNWTLPFPFRLGAKTQTTVSDPLLAFIQRFVAQIELRRIMQLMQRGFLVLGSLCFSLPTSASTSGWTVSSYNVCFKLQFSPVMHLST